MKIIRCAFFFLSKRSTASPLLNFSRELENVEHAHASVFSGNVDKKVKGSILSEVVNDNYLTVPMTSVY